MLSRRILKKEKPNEINPTLYKSDFKIFKDKNKREELKQIFKIFSNNGYILKLTDDEKDRLKEQGQLIFNNVISVNYIDIIQMLFETLYGVNNKQFYPKEIKKIIDTLFELFIYNINNDVIEIKTLINRQPTLWIYSIIGYTVKVNTNKNDYTMKIHPLIVESFNADFKLFGVLTWLYAGKP